MSHVPVQLGLQVLHKYRVQRQLILEGPPARWDLATFIELSARLFEEACYVRQVAQFCEVSPQQVRKSCLKLAEKNDQIRLAAGDVILVGPGYVGERHGSRRFYTAEAQHWLTAFTLRVVAGRLPAGDRPAAS